MQRIYFCYRNVLDDDGGNNNNHNKYFDKYSKYILNRTKIFYFVPQHNVNASCTCNCRNTTFENNVYFVLKYF